MTQIFVFNSPKLVLKEQRHNSASLYFESPCTGGGVFDMPG